MLHSILLSLVFVASLTDRAMAGGFCRQIEALFPLAEQDFPDPLPMLSAAGICTWAQDEGGTRSLHCIQEFPYRDAAAHTAFDTLNLSLADCLKGKVRVLRDQPVNHPDFYDQRSYQMKTAVLAVSLKDKAALQKTYVFLRMSRLHSGKTE